MAKEKAPKLPPLIDEFDRDKRGNTHIFLRSDFKFPAYIKAVLNEEQIAQIGVPTHTIPAKDENHLAVPSWRVTEPEHKIVFPELNYGYAEVIDADTLLLWFNTEAEAREAEELHG